MSEKLSPEKAIELITNNSLELFNDMGTMDKFKLTNKPDYSQLYSGVPHPILNGVLDAHLPSEGIQTKIDEIMAIFKENKMPIMWYVWPSSEPEDLRQQLLDYGLSHAADNPGMLADLSLLPEAKPLADGIRVEMITNDKMLEEWKTPIKVGFEMPDMVVDVFNEVFTYLGYTGDSPLRHYIAYLEDKPVSVGTVYLGKDDVAGIWNIATTPEARGKGIGTEITRRPLADAVQKGYRYGVLLASQMGYPVYQKLGFEEYCKVGYYAWMPE